jgi:hypothetical protein
MGLPWSLGTPARALLLPAAVLALSGATASRSEAASPPGGAAGAVPETVDQTSHTGPATAAGRRVLLGTTESARLKQRQAGARAASTLPLIYHAGQVGNTPEVYLSLWGSDWNGAGYQSTIDYLQGFFGNVGGSPWLGVTSQYCSGTIPGFAACGGDSFTSVGNSTGQLKATWVDTHRLSYSTPSFKCGRSFAGDCDVMAAATRAASHFGPLPSGAVVLVFTPSGRSQPGFVANGWCAYHGATTSGVVFGYIPYMPDAGGSCGRNAVSGGGILDGFSIVGGHEYAEAITDPYPDTGWIDSSGAEDAEKCAWSGLTSISLAGRPYAVQPTWSNASGGCRTGPN